VEYYSSLLVQLEHILKEKRRGKVTKGVLFLHDNAPAHRALATQKKLAYLGFHPPYSPDLAPSDYNLFPGLKKLLKGRHFSSDFLLTILALGLTDKSQHNTPKNLTLNNGNMEIPVKHFIQGVAKPLYD